MKVVFMACWWGIHLAALIGTAYIGYRHRKLRRAVLSGWGLFVLASAATDFLLPAVFNGCEELGPFLKQFYSGAPATAGALFMGWMYGLLIGGIGVAAGKYGAKSGYRIGKSIEDE